MDLCWAQSIRRTGTARATSSSRRVIADLAPLGTRIEPSGKDHLLLSFLDRRRDPNLGEYDHVARRLNRNARELDSNGSGRRRAADDGRKRCDGMREGPWMGAEVADED